jgi:predicted protein tyrosine phosphatase
MKGIKILSLEDAIKLDPPENTLLIRILGPNYLDKYFDGDFPSLTHARKFKKIFCYEFDDVKPNEAEFFRYGTEMFDEYHAREIIEDFESVYREMDYLAVHCFAGIARSSAVAAALNHIFVLGFKDEDFLNREEHNPNIHVYDTLINVARESGRVVPVFRTGQEYFPSS